MVATMLTRLGDLPAAMCAARGGGILSIVVRAEAPKGIQSPALHTALPHEADGRLIATMRVALVEPQRRAPGPRFERIIEELDGVDLEIMSRLRWTGVKRVERGRCIRDTARSSAVVARGAGVRRSRAGRGCGATMMIAPAVPFPGRSHRCRFPPALGGPGPRHRRASATSQSFAAARRNPPTSAPINGSSPSSRRTRLVAPTSTIYTTSTVLETGTTSQVTLRRPAAADDE